METEKIINCIKNAARIYSELEIAKSDCETQVDSIIDLLVSEASERITANKKKCIKKIAKAIAGGKVKNLKLEAEDITEMLASITFGGDER
jgi:hypothetical protein